MPLDTNAAPATDAQHVGPAQRLAFMRVDAAATDRLRRLQPVVHAALPAIADEFYRYLSGWPEMSAKLARLLPIRCAGLVPGIAFSPSFQSAVVWTLVHT